MLGELVFFVFLPSVHLISNGNNNATIQALLDLANYAIESRQNRYPYPYYHKPPLSPSSANYYHPYDYPPQNTDYYQHQQYQGVRPSNNFVDQNYLNYPHYTHQQNYFGTYSSPNRPPPPSSPSSQQNIMDILFSIAQNDKLKCVPRLLCELTSDTLSSSHQSRQNYFNLPSLPINFNMESIIGLLSGIDVGGSSPIPTFAKAALLGYVSKGNSYSCLNAYPTCPREADRLVQYLNNYNGGFFRFFNGINPQSNENYASNYGHYYPNNYPYKNFIAEQRIQNKPSQFINNINNDNNFNNEHNNFIFQANNINDNNNFDIKFNRRPKTLLFPTNDDDKSNNEFTFRKQKELPYSIQHYYYNDFDLQKPLPNHQASPMIFPDRTGTGELKLDTDELSENYKHTNIQNNNFVSFNPLSNNEDFNYRTPKAVKLLQNNPYNKPIFSFPE